MRAVLAWALVASVSRAIVATPATKDSAAKIVAQNADKTANSAAIAAGEDEGIEYTIFNDVRVPQMKDIVGEKFNETIKEGYW
jgi:flavoprotein